MFAAVFASTRLRRFRCHCCCQGPSFGSLRCGVRNTNRPDESGLSVARPPWKAPIRTGELSPGRRMSPPRLEKAASSISSGHPAQRDCAGEELVRNNRPFHVGIKRAVPRQQVGRLDSRRIQPHFPRPATHSLSNRALPRRLDWRFSTTRRSAEILRIPAFQCPSRLHWQQDYRSAHSKSQR